MNNDLTKYSVSVYSQKGNVTLVVEAPSVLEALHDTIEVATPIIGEKIATVQVRKYEEYDTDVW